MSKVNVSALGGACAQAGSPPLSGSASAPPSAEIQTGAAAQADLEARIIEVLKSEPTTAAHLAEQVGAPNRLVVVRLQSLRRRGLVRFSMHQAGMPGVWYR